MKGEARKKQIVIAKKSLNNIDCNSSILPVLELFSSLFESPIVMAIIDDKKVVTWVSNDRATVISMYCEAGRVRASNGYTE